MREQASGAGEEALGEEALGEEDSGEPFNHIFSLFQLYYRMLTLA